jgi:hypothetical protein
MGWGVWWGVWWHVGWHVGHVGHVGCGGTWKGPRGEGRRGWLRRQLRSVISH